MTHLELLHRHHARVRGNQVLRRAMLAFWASVAAACGLGAITAHCAQAQVTISHLTTYDVDRTGTQRGSEAWDTIAGSGPNNGFDLFIIEGKSVKGTILNERTREPSITLYNGTYTFTLLMAEGDYKSYGGLSILFDDARRPQIAAFAPNRALESTPRAQPEGASIWDPYEVTTAPGTLAYHAANGTTATLTALKFFDAGVDRVGPSESGPTGHKCLGVRFTVKITGARPNTFHPEPPGGAPASDANGPYSDGR